MMDCADYSCTCEGWDDPSRRTTFLVHNGVKFGFKSEALRHLGITAEQATNFVTGAIHACYEYRKTAIDGVQLDIQGGPVPTIRIGEHRFFLDEFKEKYRKLTEEDAVDIDS